jgi:hypothetical protein
MKFIAPKDFNQGSDNPLKIPGGEMLVKMGTVFSIGEGHASVEQLDVDELRLYRTFFAAGCLCPLESNRGQHIIEEVARLRELENVMGEQNGCDAVDEWWKKPAGIVLFVVVGAGIIVLLATFLIRYFRS